MGIKGGCSDPECGASSGVAFEEPSFGKGELNSSGYWSEPCGLCARRFEKVHPKYGECSPEASDDQCLARRKELLGDLRDTLVEEGWYGNRVFTRLIQRSLMEMSFGDVASCFNVKSRIVERWRDEEMATLPTLEEKRNGLQRLQKKLEGSTQSLESSLMAHSEP